MLAPEFAKGYQAHLDPDRIHHGPQPELMHESRMWSHALGKVLHQRLTEPTAGAIPEPQIPTSNDYGVWAENNHRNIQAGIAATYQTDPDGAVRLMTESNFHPLTAAMVLMWGPILDGKWGREEERLHAIRYAQDALAFSALANYISRTRGASPKYDYQLFDPRIADIRAVQEGALQEIDVGILLLDVARQNPGLTVVPAPMQFERTNSRYNVDYVAYDSQKHTAAGVQVKSQVHSETASRYDPRRVALVDGRVDLGNVKAIRTSSANSAVKEVNWPGIIAVNHLAGLSYNGKHASPLLEIIRMRDFLLLKNYATQLNTIKLNRPELSKRVAQRLLPLMELDH